MASKEIGPKEWLRCNKCFSLMCQAKDPFSLTFCGHIFCSQCIRKATKQCPQCKCQEVRALPLKEPLEPGVKHCFETTEELSEKLRQATLFQIGQYKVNNQRLVELEKKYAHVKKEYFRKSNELKNVVDKTSKIQKRNQEIESRLKELTLLKNSCVASIPKSNVSSLASSSAQSLRSLESMRYGGPSFSRSQSFHQSMSTPTKPQGLDVNGDFRIPNVKKVPRSIGSSSRSSTNSSRSRAAPSPFSNYSPF